MRSRKVAGVAVMTALATASAYATAAIPNVTLMDVVVFVSGWILGAAGGATVGCLSWVVYGLLNPYGFNLVVWVATTSCEALYGLAGGLARRLAPHPLGRSADGAAMLGALGFACTFTYDVITNAAFALAFNVPLLTALALGAPFALVHEVSNFLLFALVAPPALRAVGSLTLPRPLSGGGGW
ncbi:MAG: hypothetical protein QXT74_04410 [Candidatus Nezhaarchaeales archaeon]